MTVKPALVRIIAAVAALATAGCGSAAGEPSIADAAATASGTLPAPSLAATLPGGVTPAVPSGARCYGMLADSPGVGVLLFGGWARPESGFDGYQPLEAFDGEVWTAIPTREVPEPGDLFATDRRSGQAVFVEAEGRTWAYDPATGVWERRQVWPAPPAHGSRMAYDAGSARLVAFGGDRFGPPSDDTWAYDATLGAWEKMAPHVRPRPRSYFAIAYDEGSDRIVMFGGGSEADTWAYDLDTDAWTRLDVAVAPPPRAYAAMAYDSGTDRIILFGGVTGPSEKPLADTWSLDLESATWSRLAGEGPSARGWHAMTADREAGVIVLFGGGPTRDRCTDETWVFAPGSGSWSPAP